jgi:hypothetical protein
MCDELERIRKEAIVIELRFEPDIYLEELRKTTKELVRIPVFWPRFEWSISRMQVQSTAATPTCFSVLLAGLCPEGLTLASAI